MYKFLKIPSVLILVIVVGFCSTAAIAEDNDVDREGNLDEVSLWNSLPIEQFEANIQILDKISGKVFRQKIKLGTPVTFGTISIKLKRCFRNSPEEKKEVYAFLEVEENEQKIFSNWLFASSLSINLFAHPVYDLRVEFNEQR